MSPTDGIPEADLSKVLKPIAEILEPLSLDQKRRVLGMFWILYGLDETDALPLRRRRSNG